MKEELQNSLLFARMDDAQLSSIVNHAVRLKLASDEPLFEQGDSAERFYYVVSGQIKLYRLSPAGNEKIIDIVLPGQTFAEALMFLESPRYPVGAQALERSEVISVAADKYSQILRESGSLCLLLLGDMSQRLRGLIREIDELSLHSATCRVAAYIYDLSPPNTDYFDLPVAKQVIASRLSVKPETFSRIIKNLQSDGVISVNGARVKVHDRNKLAVAADHGSSTD